MNQVESNARATLPERYHALDVLRWFAAIVVVIWHYQHFFTAGSELVPFDRSVQPFYKPLWLFYEHGLEAVLLFFVLSGFIFFRLYRKAIRKNEVSAMKFFVLRFSRLYPLHFFTLLLVAALQFFYQSKAGGYFVYENNDFFHFMLNTGLASYWGFQDGLSFNGPIWSVSLEVMLYAQFFMFSRMGFASLPGTVLITCIGLALVLVPGNLGTGFFCFFAGGLVCHFCELISTRYKSRLKTAMMVSFLALAAAIGIYQMIASLELNLYGPFVNLLLIGGIFPLIVMSLVLAQDAYPGLAASWLPVGNLTYSVYLLHFPLQLVFRLFEFYSGRRLDYTSPVVFLTFMAALLVLSTYCYYYFEVPAQSAIRNWYRSKGKSRSFSTARAQEIS